MRSLTCHSLRIAGLEALYTDPQAEPPPHQLAQVEQCLCGSEGHTVIAADVGGQSAPSLKSRSNTVKAYFSLVENSASQVKQITASVIGDRQRISVLMIAQQKFALCNPCTTVHWVAGLTAAASHGHDDAPDRGAPPSRSDPASHGWYFSPGWEYRRSAAASAPGFCDTPTGVLVLPFKMKFFDLERKLVGVTSIYGRRLLSVSPFHAAFLITIENLIGSLAGDADSPQSSAIPRRLAGEPNCSLSSITEHSFQGITPSPLREKVSPMWAGTMCYLCLRSLSTVALELEKSPFRFRRVIARLFITVLSQTAFRLRTTEFSHRQAE